MGTTAMWINTKGRVVTRFASEFKELHPEYDGFGLDSRRGVFIQFKDGSKVPGDMFDGRAFELIYVLSDYLRNKELA